MKVDTFQINGLTSTTEKYAAWLTAAAASRAHNLPCPGLDDIKQLSGVLNPCELQAESRTGITGAGIHLIVGGPGILHDIAVRPAFRHAPCEGFIINNMRCSVNGDIDLSLPV